MLMLLGGLILVTECTLKRYMTSILESLITERVPRVAQYAGILLTYGKRKFTLNIISRRSQASLEFYRPDLDRRKVVFCTSPKCPPQT